jgi:hypothetical protein
VSSLAPERFNEVSVRVYTRDPTKVKQVQEAFSRLLASFGRNHFIPSPNPAHLLPSDWTSPTKRKRCTNSSDRDVVSDVDLFFLKGMLIGTILVALNYINDALSFACLASLHVSTPYSYAQLHFINLFFN